MIIIDCGDKMNVINKFTSKVTNFVNEKKKAYELYNQRVNNSLKFNLNMNINVGDENILEGKIAEYKEMCVYLNDKQALAIASLIPLNETVIYIVQITQKIDDQIYFMILTNLRIIILKGNLYSEMGYNSITAFELINKSFMSQTINFNGVILGIDVNQNDLNILYSLLVNIDYRNNYINELKRYLCGINPIYQRLNKINTGISIDANKNIVFHNKKINNYLCKYDDILNYELMEDTTPVMKRKTKDENTSMPFSKKECMQISLRVTMVNKQVFEIIILEPSTFNNTYSHTNSTYMKNYNFGKELMEKLDSLNDTLY